METISALLAFCAGNSPVPGEFPTQRPVTRSFDVYFDLINGWVDNREASDLRLYRGHYDVTVMNQRTRCSPRVTCHKKCFLPPRWGNAYTSTRMEWPLQILGYGKHIKSFIEHKKNMCAICTDLYSIHRDEACCFFSTTVNRWCFDDTWVKWLLSKILTINNTLVTLYDLKVWCFIRVFLVLLSIGSYSSGLLHLLWDHKDPLHVDVVDIYLQRMGIKRFTCPLWRHLKAVSCLGWDKSTSTPRRLSRTPECTRQTYNCLERVK